MTARTHVFILYNDLPGGAENVFKQMALHLVNNNKSLIVLFLGPRKSEFWNSFNTMESVVLCDDLGWWGAFKKLKSLKNYRLYTTHILINAFVGFLRTVRLIDPELLIVRESTSVFLRYSGFRLLIYRLAYRIGYRNMDLVITQTDFMKRDLFSKVPYLQKRLNVHTIPNPFHFPQGEIQKVSDVKTPFIVAAGRLIPEKGFDVLIEAFEMLHLKNSQYHLYILGEGLDRPDLEEKILAHSLSEHIHLIGFVEDVFAYFKRAEVCVVSSIREGFPNVLLQMMSQNDKVVSTLCAGGISEIEGLSTAPPNNPEKLYEAILEVSEINVDETRLAFDRELQNRSISNFFNQMNTHLGHA